MKKIVKKSKLYKEIDLFIYVAAIDTLKRV